MPFFSPDGQWIGFAANGKVNKIFVEGGAVVPLGEFNFFGGASWAEDGTIFVSDVIGKGLVQLPAAGGSPEIVVPRGNAEPGLFLPQLLPGDKALLLAACPPLGGSENCDIEALTLADGRRTVLARGGGSPLYLPSSTGTGHLVYVNKATLFAIPLDPLTLETRGTAVPVLDDVGFATRSGAGLFQARADGAGQPQVLTESQKQQGGPSFTPDGKRLAYLEDADGRTQIWTVPLEDQGGQLKAGKPERFLTSNFQNLSPSFSPDGRWLAYHSNESGRDEVYVREFPPPTSSQAGRWQVSNNGGVDPQWSRTGHELVYRSGDQLMTANYSVTGDTFVAEKPRVWIAELGGTAWDLAPDGKRVAVVIPEAAAQAPQREHVIVMLQNFADELRRRVPIGK